MSFQDAWAALHLDMPPRVPRTEYSVTEHWDLVRAVTGIDARADAPEDVKLRARKAFVRKWDFGLHWSTAIGPAEFGDRKSFMGHAAYASGGTDYSARTAQLFDQPEDALRLDPMELYGRKDKAGLIRRFEEHYRQNVAFDADAVNMTGIYITCISGLVEILGWETLLTAAGVDLKAFGDLTHRYAGWIEQYFLALAEADVPVVMIHDDIVWTAGPFLPPDWYRQYVFPNYRRLFAPLREAGKKVLFTSDGNYTAFIDDIAATGVHGFVMEPTTDMAYVARKYGRTHAFVGNADTRVLLMGSQAVIRAEVERCMAIGKDCPGFFLAVGNHIPANTLVANAIYYNDVYEELARR
jgi:hypothetical protein